MTLFLNKSAMEIISSMPFEDAVHAAAIQYASVGIPVIPLEPGSKRLPPGGGISYAHATFNKSTVAKWFGKGGKYRGCNIGMACGKQGGVMALDIDSKPVGGTTGIKELEKIIKNYGNLPPGPRQRTPSGGYHHIFRWREGAASSSSKVADGIDTRGGTVDRCTGHIVVFPSIINDKQYVWEEWGEIPEMPKWLIEAMGSPWNPGNSGAPAVQNKPEQVHIPADQITRMLVVIDIDSLSYDEWVKIGMALKKVCPDDGLELWDDWSSKGARRKEGECKYRWKTFTDDGEVGFGTLSFIAKSHGWRPLPGDVINSSDDSSVEERVLEMNKKYALVRIAKSLVVATFEDNREGMSVDFLSMSSFRDLAAPEKVLLSTKNGGFINRPMADIWMASPLRREYNGTGIFPNGNCPEKMLNLWNGWAVAPSEEGSCELYTDHLLRIICNGDKNHYEWVMDWMADAVQDARNVKGSCIVLRGIEGCGKGVFADTFGSLFGKHYCHLIDSERLTGRFNSHLTDSIVVFADEVLWPGDRKAGNVLKAMVSERRVHRESKGVDIVEYDNLTRLIIASNEEWVVPAGPQSRRWFVLNVSPSKTGNREYFNSLMNEINNGGRAKLLHVLMNRKITRDIRVAPITDALREQRMMSCIHDTLTGFLSEIVERGGFHSVDSDVRIGDHGSWPHRLLKYELYKEYREWASESRISRFDFLSLGMFLKRLTRYGFTMEEGKIRVPSRPDLRKTVSEFQGLN